ncbi:MAG: hypothetical protein EOO11_23535 [Chitinophagaceae bacterium]|nr:MAG: hypothetical protein EOO11_23535 [Chitinophagaceae bacterium]
MERDQLNYHEMMGKLKAHFKAHETLWNGNTLLQEPVNKLFALYQDIENAALVQAGGSSGELSAKDALLEAAAPEAELMATRLRSFARRGQNAALFAEANVSVSDLKYSRQDDRIRHMKRIAAAARTHLADLAPYNITAEMVDHLESLLKSAATYRDNDSEHSNHVTVATARIAALITEARTLIEYLDDDVRSFITDADFVDAYFVARRITDRAATRKPASPTAG